MDLTTRNCDSRRFFVLLAPNGAVPETFSAINVNRNVHAELLGQMQRLRGRIYLKDGAIQSSDLTADGKHISNVDQECWHLLTMNTEGRVLGCARFHKHPSPVKYEHLSVRHASISRSEEWGAKVQEAVESEIEASRTEQLFWVEMGGWALTEELRGSTEALMYALATYAWSQLMGGAIGISTVTQRNSSSAILRRLGGQSLHWRGTELPSYYDERYRCNMELLRFDSRFPAPKYVVSIESLRCQIANVPVFCVEEGPGWRHDAPLSQLPARLAGLWATAEVAP